MIILSVLIVLVLLGVVISRISEYESLLGCALLGFSSIVLTIAMMFLAVNRVETNAEIARFKAIEASRPADANSMTAAAWQLKVAEQNGWLAEQKYYNRGCFDIWVPDAVEALQPVK